MIRKALTVGILSIGLVTVVAQPGTRQRVASSIRNFEQSFQDLKVAGNSLNPLERLVFSVLLASTSAPPGGS
jgi:hypothetical protein